MTQKATTPLMQQYFEIKEQYPNALLLFQVGDFYELFFEDARTAAAYLGIALTSRGTYNDEPIPLCGVPLHALDHYLNKLVKGGYNAALCNQLEEAQAGKLVRRGVTQVLTPGTLTDTRLLDEKSPSYLLSFVPLKDGWGLIFGELLTAQIFATTIPADGERTLEAEIGRFLPDEILVPSTREAQKFQKKFSAMGYCTTVVPAEGVQKTADADNEGDRWIATQFGSQQAQQINNNEPLQVALHYFYAYVRKTQAEALTQFNTITFYNADDYLLLDAATQRNLELIGNYDGGRKNSLFAVMDDAVTPMGSRLIKKWIQRPLINHQAISQRLEVVGLLAKDITLQTQVRDVLVQLGDIERVVGRIGVRRAQLYDFMTLKRALHVTPYIRTLVRPYKKYPLIDIIIDHLGEFTTLHQLLVASLNDDPSKEWLIKKGFDHTLDHVRLLIEDSSQAIMRMEQQEQEKTGIQSLKIRYNQVHGYYIEVTKTNSAFVPDSYVRQQTLVGRERYITVALQQLQTEIITAQSQSERLEKEVFERIKNEVLSRMGALRKLAYALAHLDALASFGYSASVHGYTAPSFDDSRDIAIINGRHPVVERTSGSFIPNDTHLNDAQSLWIITGPNMGGKSTYLRQVALISIMAQCGSFVPAQKAQLPLLDRVFTRIGAGDNVAEGKSTFLVEMEETAVICSQATEKSLVILDEVGRGTSTFDGLAIAQAVVEFLYLKVKARCLFATHYHELTDLQKNHDGIKSYYAASRKTTEGIIFLYKMTAGVADGSFGVDVARLAQLPTPVIIRAQELLHALTHKGHTEWDQRSDMSQGNFDQILIAEYERLLQAHKDSRRVLDELSEQIRGYKKRLTLLEQVDYDHLSPRQAFDFDVAAQAGIAVFRGDC